MKRPDLLPAQNRAKVQQGLEMHRQGRLEEAEVIYREVLRLEPRNFDAMHFRGVVALQTGRAEQAAELIGRAIKLNPNVASVYFNQGYALQVLQRYKEAIASYDKAIALKPDYADAYGNRGNVLKDLMQNDEAIASYDQAIALRPDFAEVYSNRGNALQNLKRYDEAIASYDRAVELKAGFAEAFYNRGNALKSLTRYAEAVGSYDRAISLRPGYAEAHLGRGTALGELNRPKEALASFDRAIALKPDIAEAHCSRGLALHSLKRYEEAIAQFDRAITLNPAFAEAHSIRGLALQNLNRREEAVASYDKAIALKPDLAATYANCANVLFDLKRYEEAVARYHRAILLEPKLSILSGSLEYANLKICNWPGATHRFDVICELARDDQAVSLPFPFLTLCGSPELQRKVAERYVTTVAQPADSLPPIPKHKRRDKIRLGYFSADFHNHATAWLTANLFERHDKSCFELIAFSFGPETQDQIRQRLAMAFDRFIDVSSMSEEEIALLARQLKIDIAVDLKGFTQDARPRIFSARAAPIQVSFLGYPGTMGAEFIDYLIADAVVVPSSDRRYYAEKIAYLPNSYYPNSYKYDLNAQLNREEPLTRLDVGLPRQGFVFCCFNNNYKILPDVFDSWMKIMRGVDGSVLWLFEDNVTAASNLRQEASARGVEPERLVFAKPLSPAKHMERHRLADLFLDTLPYNAHTTATDALWAGLPVLTRVGDSFAGRVAASLLKAVGLTELITSTPQAYESLAIDLATDPEKLGQMKQRLADRRLSAPLFDTELFTRHLEAAYAAMYERYQADLSPDDIHVPE